MTRRQHVHATGTTRVMTNKQARAWLLCYAADLLYAFVDTEAITNRAQFHDGDALTKAELEAEVLQGQIARVRARLYKLAGRASGPSEDQSPTAAHSGSRGG